MSRLPKRLNGILKCYCWSLLYTHDCAAHESCSSMLSDSKAFFFFSYKCLLSAFCTVKHHTFIDKNHMHNSSQTVNGMTNKNKIIKKKFFICAPFFSCHRNKQEYEQNRGTEKCHPKLRGGCYSAAPGLMAVAKLHKKFLSFASAEDCFVACGLRLTD